MTDTVSIPGIKKPLPKTAVVAGVAGVGVAIFLYYRHKNSTASPAAAATSTDQYPPDGTTGDPSDPYSTDPATGQTYGDESVGSGGTFGAFASPTASESGIIGYDGNGNPIYAPGYGPQPGSGTGGPPFANNSAWSNWAIQQIEASNPSVDAGALTAALGLYLAGQPIDATQKTLIFEAQAIAGPPPVPGPGNYPPNVRTNGGKGGGPPAAVAVPGVVGRTVDQADVYLKAAGLTYNTDTAKDKHGYDRIVTRSEPKAGTKVPRGSHVGLTWKYEKQR